MADDVAPLHALRPAGARPRLLPEWAEAGRFLARSIPDLYASHPLAAQLAMWDAAGIEDVQVRRMSFGAGVVTWGRRAGPAD